MLNTASRTRSEVGRVPRPGGAFSRRPPAVPPMIRMAPWYRLLDASLKAKSASLTIKFISQIISATKDKEGRVIEGDPNKVREVTDIWTFMRDLTSRDPNWKLVATEAAN